MGEQTNKVRRRPVDALFGEKDTGVPSYVVEPARPVTNISPPPPSRPKTAPPAKDQPPPAPPVEPAPSSKRAPAPASQAAPASQVATASQVYIPPTYTPASYEPSEEPTAPFETAAQFETASTFEPATSTPYYDAPAIAPETTPGQTSTSPDGDFAHIGEMIQQLYDQVTAELYDSPVVTEYCLKMLMQARDAYLKKDYATAEFYAESVAAKIKRSAQSVQASRSFKMVLLWFWEFGMLGVSGVVIALTYIPGLTLLEIPVGADFAILLRAVGWGGIGGVIGALYNLPWFIQFREYDPAYNMNYVARPPQGMLIGAILFLLSQAGILAGNTVIPGLGMTPEASISVGPVVLYLIAALAGFKQEYVYQFFDNLLKTIFRIPDVPSGIKMPELPRR